MVAGVVEALAGRWHNPSSTHRPGQAARAAVELARRDLAELLGVRARELVLVSGGTESIDLAFRGTLGAHRARAGATGPARIITSKVEHAAVRDVAADLEQTGQATVVHLPLDAQGRIDVAALSAALHDPSFGFTLVSVQWANNETGVIQPVEAVHALCAEHGAIFHCDAVQWVGRMPVTADPAPLTDAAIPAHRHARTGLPPCDLLTFSAHKFHGPKGVGGLWIRQGVKVRPVLGGTQELGRRGGTENVPGIVGAGVASGRGARWKVVGEMVIAWIVTIPAAALIAFVMYELTRLPTILAWIVIGAVVIGFGGWVIWAMRHTIHADDVEAEILPEEVLDEHIPVHPHLKGDAPVE